MEQLKRYLTLILIGILVLPAIGLSEISPTTIVGAWLFERNTQDSSLAGNHGRIEGSATWTDGVFGQAFDPNGAFVVVSHTDSLNLNHMTIAAWILVRNYTDDARILEKGVGTSDPWSVYNFLLSDPGESKLEFRPTIGGAGGRQRIHTDTDVPLNEWTHVAATYDGTHVVLYINGQVEITQPLSGDLMQNDTDVYIAESEFYDRAFGGALDEVMLLNVPLAEADIQALMSDGLDVILAVGSAGKLAVTWGHLRLQ